MQIYYKIIDYSFIELYNVFCWETREQHQKGGEENE